MLQAFFLLEINEKFLEIKGDEVKFLFCKTKSF